MSRHFALPHICNTNKKVSNQNSILKVDAHGQNVWYRVYKEHTILEHIEADRREQVKIARPITDFLLVGIYREDCQ